MFYSQIRQDKYSSGSKRKISPFSILENMVFFIDDPT